MRRAFLLIGVLLAVAVMTAPVAASTTYRSYLGTLSGSHGSARLTVYTSRAGGIYVNAKSMVAGSWSETIYRGTCTSLSTRVAILPKLVVGSTGKVVRANSLTTAQMASLKGYRSVVRMVLGSRVVCAPFATAAVPSAPKAASNCHPSYTPCLPIVADLNCPDVRAMGKSPVTVHGPDDYRLDADHDGIGCE